MVTFITNSKNLGSKNLKDRLQEVIEISTELKILVGFLHFSGINELYETLRKLYKENRLSQEHIKILIGIFNDKGKDKDIDMEAEKFDNKATDIESKRKERFIRRDLICSIQKNLIYSAKVVFDRIQQDPNEDDIINMIDTKEKQVEFFIELLEKKIVVIKKTEPDNHSKFYLFKTRETSAPYLFITGSSNLTNLGLTGRGEYGYGGILQDEFNIEIKGYGFEEVEKYFDDLWENAILLSEDSINEIKKIVLPPKKSITDEKSITEECCMIKVYEDSCLEMLQDKENESLEIKDYYVDKIKDYYICKDIES